VIAQPPTPESIERPSWATALSLFCFATVVFLVYGDLFVPGVHEVEVWLGFELTGIAAWLTAPLHWALYALAAWGYWHGRPWVWPWASVYAFIVAVSHLVWNGINPAGEGWTQGLLQLALFSLPAVALLWARPKAIGGRDPW
jgi:hypothetical protein